MRNGIRNISNIKKIFMDPTILICIRRQPELIASLYMSNVRRGGKQSVDKFVEKILSKSENNLFDHFKLFDYYHIINLLTDQFGSDKVNLFVFEQFKENQYVAIKRLVEKLDFEVDLQAIDFSPSNISYKANTLKISLLLNKFHRRRSLQRNDYILNVPYLFKLSNSLLHYFNQTRWAGKRLSSREILGNNNYDKIARLYSIPNEKLVCNNPWLEKWGYKL